MLRALTILAVFCLFTSCNKRDEARDSALKEEREKAILKQHSEYEEELREASERKKELESRRLEINRKFEVAEANRRLSEAAEAEANATEKVKKAAIERKAARKAILHKQFSSLSATAHAIKRSKSLRSTILASLSPIATGHVALISLFSHTVCNWRASTFQHQQTESIQTPQQSF